MAVAEEVGLEDPGRGCHAAPAQAPIAGRRTGTRNRPCRLKSRIGPRRARGRSCQVGASRSPSKAEQGIKRRMAVRLLASERPEVGQDLGVEEQLGAGVDLLGTRRRCSGLLDQLERGWGWASGRRTPADREGPGTTPAAGPRGRACSPRPRRSPGAARWRA